MTAHQSNVRVEGLRKVMRERNIQAYYIPTEDAHQVGWGNLLCDANDGGEERVHC